ncbi:MAG: hypothetical protein KY469_10845 [Actinobacteria bacterium]|nr:hypothetical protein [Actinomycetota bacterium]
MKWSNEPVMLSALVAGLFIAASSALVLLDSGATLYLAIGTALGQLGIVTGGGAVARSHAWGPKTVDTIMDADVVIAAAERGEHG